MFKGPFKHILLFMALALILTSCSPPEEPAESNDTGNTVNTSFNETLEPKEETSAAVTTETFRAAIRLYDAKDDKAMPYSPCLTMQEQSFILNFNMPADRDSVEEAVADNILNIWRGEYVKPVKPTLSFNWINDTTLVLTADNLTSNSYCIHLENSKDTTGMHVIGEGHMVDSQGVHFNMLEFEILNRQKIFIFNPGTLKYREIPIDSRYYYAYGNISPSGKTAFIGRITSSFEAVHYMPSFVDLANRNITDVADDSYMDISGSWAEEKLLLYNNLLDAQTGTCNMAFKAHVMSSLMLRNGEYVSLTTVNDTNRLILTRYSADGIPVWDKELPDSCSVRIWEGGFFQRPVLYELADGSIVTTFYNNESQMYNVYKLDLSSSEGPAVLLHENSFIAAASPDAKRYAIYKDLQNGFISSKVEIHSLEGFEKTIVDEELAKNMCLFWQNDKLYVCNSGYRDHIYIHVIDVPTGKGRTIRPNVTDNVSGFAGITPEGEVVMIESHYCMALFR